jgi:stage IV sporulation protein B
MGIRMQTEGVIVIGFSPVITAEGNKTPASDSGVKIGDRITHIDGAEVESSADFLGAVKTSGDTVVARFVRESVTKTVEIKPAIAAQNGEKRLGVLVRDGMSGIGTMTFYDPASGLFGALGHGVNDSGSGLLLPMASGDIIPSVVTDIKRGRAGNPGELRGDFPDSARCGDILINSSGGIFGFLKDKRVLGGSHGRLTPIADHTQVKTGPAKIYSNVRGDSVESFDIEIVKLFDKNDVGRNIMIKVTDPDLLALTGGIVQGMSGSPIIQDGKLIGAVTHVLINDPERGYGIYVENMLAEGYALRQLTKKAS